MTLVMSAVSEPMKIKIRPNGVTVTKAQRVRLERDLEIELARFGPRIDRVIVAISKGNEDGFKSCEIEVRMKPQIVKVEDSDANVFLAVEHAAKRAARSVGRAIDTEGVVRRS